MNAYDVICESFCACPCCGLPAAQGDRIVLGRGAAVYLYPKIPPLPGLQNLKKASLYLFKLPVCRNRPIERCRFWAAPLLDFYTACCPAGTPPRVHRNLRADFTDDPSRCVLEADVTAIAQAWLNGEVENRGLMLSGAGCCRVSCASHRCEMAYMRPTLRLFTEDTVLCQPLRAMDCIVTTH